MTTIDYNSTLKRPQKVLVRKNSPEEKKIAISTVCRAADNPQDAALILQALGLIPYKQ